MIYQAASAVNGSCIRIHKAREGSSKVNAATDENICRGLVAQLHLSAAGAGPQQRQQVWERRSKSQGKGAGAKSAAGQGRWQHEECVMHEMRAGQRLWKRNYPSRGQREVRAMCSHCHLSVPRRRWDLLRRGIPQREDRFGSCGEASALGVPTCARSSHANGSRLAGRRPRCLVYTSPSVGTSASLHGGRTSRNALRCRPGTSGPIDLTGQSSSDTSAAPARGLAHVGATKASAVAECQ